MPPLIEDIKFLFSSVGIFHLLRRSHSHVLFLKPSVEQIRQPFPFKILYNTSRVNLRSQLVHKLCLNILITG
jgi:hypothetical protein